MDWTELLKSEIESAYKGAERLLDLVDEDRLDWKPSEGANWMTTGQLLMHLADACGAPMRGFVTGDWGLPAGVDTADSSPAEMLPPAEKLPTLGSVSDAKALLAQDKQLALDMLGRCDEDELANRTSRAPWDPTEMILGHRLLQMVA
ncbi:MAG TPA: DinB family protein, partial [Candidatus Hydrogenedentes bacterium]|nr:DinB family protein [Candidatus Hydrogenedentota bacterium]